MKPEQQRIAIAEACGWEVFHAPKKNLLSEQPRWQVRHLSGKIQSGWQEVIQYGCGDIDVIDRLFLNATDGMDRCGVPDYLNDLNAMHEAEKMLVAKGVNAWWGYVGNLNRDNPTPLGAETAVHATAAQRAKAFLKTLRLWKEE